MLQQRDSGLKERFRADPCPSRVLPSEYFCRFFIRCSAAASVRPSTRRQVRHHLPEVRKDQPAKEGIQRKEGILDLQPSRSAPMLCDHATQPPRVHAVGLLLPLPMRAVLRARQPTVAIVRAGRLGLLRRERGRDARVQGHARQETANVPCTPRMVSHVRESATLRRRRRHGSRLGAHHALRLA